MTREEIRIMLVDDHNVVRLGLTSLFGTVPHFKVVGEASSSAGAVSEARKTLPDVVIMDVRLPDGSGVEACREIRSIRPQTRVIMLTSYSDEDAILDSILAGAAGYLLKQIEPSRLIEAVEEVANGGSLLDPAVTQTVLTWMRRHGTLDPTDPLATLTEPERRILPLIASGKTNREIATTLYLSEHTVKSYVSNILQKLHLNRRAEAAAFIARLKGSSEP
jgi:DNA-binding NarL/FixJ family response regulator